MNKLYRISCLGGCSIDNYIDQKKLLAGGCGLNTAVHFKRLMKNVQVSIVGAIGNDTYSRTILKTIKKYNILSKNLHQINGDTAIQPIRNQKNREKIFLEYKPGVILMAHLTAPDKKLLRSQDLIIGSLFIEIEKYFKSALQTKGRGLVAIDFRNLSNYGYHTDIVTKYINFVDIGFFGLNKNEETLIPEIARLAQKYKKLFIITLAKTGSMAFYDSTKYQQDALPVKKIVDTTGAGDAYAAAFLAHYLETKNIADSLYEGSKYAAKIIQKYGAI